MRRCFKGIVLVMVLLAVGGYFCYRDFQSFCQETVPILAYHRVDDLSDRYTILPETFDKQMAYLAQEGYTTLTLDKYAAARRAGKAFHKNVVVIFDDGYRDNLTKAAPIMKKYGFVGSMYMAVKFEGWPGYLDWQGEEELLKYGWEIGSHTFSHVPLTTLSQEQVRSELEKSSAYIRGLYNPPSGITLSFPTGATNALIEKEVAAAKYSAAVSGDVGVNTATTPLLHLNRVNIFQYKQMQSLKLFRAALLKAQLRSWSLSHGVDLIGWWDKLRGNAK